MERQQWSSKLGFILAAVGAAVGLGNIWKFPYTMGTNGGFIFLIFYLICIFLIGMPALVSELILGRRNQANAVASMRKEYPDKPFYATAGWFGLITALLVLGFYVVVAGWAGYYTFAAITGKLDFSNVENAKTFFDNFKLDNVKPLIWLSMFLLLNITILIGGVKDGIEKASKILMPGLFVILIMLIFRSLTLDGASEGVKYMFKPDFSQFTFKTVLASLGQAFFTLSIGMGTMITYGSYLRKEDDIIESSIHIITWDTVIALLSGLAIFPAVFALGFSPTEGPGLTFITIPAVLSSIPGGTLFGILFFFSLTVAALTSSMSIYEVLVAYFTETFNIKRSFVIVGVGIVLAILGTIVSSTLGVPLFGNSDLFDTLGIITDYFLMPLGGLIMVFSVGWSMKKSEYIKELGDTKFVNVLYFLSRYVAPTIIVIFFVCGVLDLFHII